MSNAPAPSPAELVETVARAMWGVLADDNEAVLDAVDRDQCRRLAAAAIAALPPSPAEEAVKRRVHLAAENAWAEGYEACYRGEQRYRNPYRAALASPAPAPHGEEGQR